MHVKYLLTIWLLLSALFISAQEQLIQYKDLEFVSEFEQTQFESLQAKQDIHNFELFFAIYQDTNGLAKAQKRFNKLIREIKNENILKKKEKKQIKRIYSLVHDAFLKKYDRYSYFPDVFGDGTYNCMSASLLYSLIFQELGIPYEIKEEPQHVFLIAYPATLGIKVETTDPKGGTTVYNGAFKVAYVKYLANNKIISQDELTSTSSEELFNIYFHNQKSISLMQLLALQYYNAGVFASEKELYEPAVRYLKKSSWIYPDNKIEYLTFYCALNLLGDSDVGSEQHASYLNFISRYDDTQVKKENIVGEFQNILQKILIDQSDTATMRKLFHIVVKDMPDSSTVDEITFQYVYRMGLIYAEQEAFQKAFPLLEQAYVIKPQHLYTEKLMVAAFMEVCDDTENGEELLELFNTFLQKHSIDDKDGELKNQHKVLLLEAAEEKLLDEQYEEALEYVRLFEETYPLEESKDWQLRSAAENTYGKISGYYFKKRKYKLAKEYVDKGLIIFPESYGLKRRQKALR